MEGMSNENGMEKRSKLQKGNEANNQLMNTLMDMKHDQKLNRHMHHAIWGLLLGGSTFRQNFASGKMPHFDIKVTI